LLGKFTLESPIIEISNKNNTTREITMLVHTFETNYNGLQFTEDYTNQFMNTLIDKPVVCEYYPVEDDLGDHAVYYSSDGEVELRTIAIGTINQVWVGDHQTNNETKRALFAKAVVWSYKYPQIMSCIEKLFNSKQSSSSVEIEVYSYEEGATWVQRIPDDYSYLANCLLSSSVAPADPNAGVLNVFQREVAMAVNQDLKLHSVEGGQNVSEKNSEQNKEEKVVFNKGKEIKFHGKVENSELSYGDISNQIYNLINPIDPETEQRTYNYWIRELFQSYAIIEDWYNSEEDMYKVNYTITNDTVSIDPKEQWIAVELVYQPKGTDIQAELNKKMEEAIQLNTKVEELNNLVIFSKEGAVQLEQKIADLEAKIESMTQEHATKIAELEQEKTELSEYKTKWETHEKEVKVKEISDKYQKLISAECFKTEEVQNAIQALDESVLKDIVIKEVSEKMKSVETASAKPDDVTITVSTDGKDLLPSSKRDKLYAVRD